MMKWFMSLPYWSRISLALTLAAAMFALAWRLHRERAAAEAVWATGAQAVEWPLEELPIRVWGDPEFGSHLRSLSQAVTDINQAAGCILLAETPSREIAHVEVVNEGCETAENHAGCTFRDPTTSRFLVKVGQPGDITQSYLIFYHELAAHVLGLAHDGRYPIPRDPAQAMQFIPITAVNAPEHAYRLGQGLLLPQLSDKDRAALQERYCASRRR